MSRNLGFPLLILLTIGLGTLLYYNTCSSCATSSTSTSVIQGINPRTDGSNSLVFSRTLALVFPDGQVIRSGSNFIFGFSSPHFDLPVQEALNPSIVGLRTFLDENENYRLSITGLSRADESNPTAFSSLGIARANQVKEYLKTKDFRTAQITLEGLQANDSLDISYGKINGPVEWKIERIPPDMAGELEESVQDSLVINFETEGAGIQLNEDQKNQFTAFYAYLDWTQEAKLEITGHSADTGSDKDSFRMGMKRADVVRKFFRENGVPDNRMKSGSAGHNQAVASNRTTEGRMQNNRVVVQIILEKQ
ncbi:OmpA family protein [Aureicoccus marinus]|uniref:OmpA-like domain-containing protein n=1 Tax=Aureicoccus marinus TaxID=754435 RepID=A0A2S7T9X4_9FLAO|nr:OmpA family protein [Aureicoccus marinus]PQJ16348.1 hypothetical protein BST99_12035 [Aureicoccus marinus]